MRTKGTGTQKVACPGGVFPCFLPCFLPCTKGPVSALVCALTSNAKRLLCARSTTTTTMSQIHQSSRADGARVVPLVTATGHTDADAGGAATTTLPSTSDHAGLVPTVQTDANTDANTDVTTDADGSADSPDSTVHIAPQHGGEQTQSDKPSGDVPVVAGKRAGCCGCVPQCKAVMTWLADTWGRFRNGVVWACVGAGLDIMDTVTDCLVAAQVVTLAMDDPTAIRVVMATLTVVSLTLPGYIATAAMFLMDDNASRIAESAYGVVKVVSCTYCVCNNRLPWCRNTHSPTVLCCCGGRVQHWGSTPSGRVFVAVAGFIVWLALLPFLIGWSQLVWVLIMLVSNVGDVVLGIRNRHALVFASKPITDEDHFGQFKRLASSAFRVVEDPCQLAVNVWFMTQNPDQVGVANVFSLVLTTVMIINTILMIPTLLKDMGSLSRDHE